MVLRSRLDRVKRTLLTAVTVLALAVGFAAETTSVSHAVASAPCDIYASGGTPCVAAHSTTRALFGSYSGPLYQVQRTSDSKTQDIGVLRRRPPR